MFLLVVQNYIVSFEKNGYPIELAFAAMFSRDAFTLAISDGVLVLATGICVPFATALRKGWLNFSPWGLVLQHTYQTLFLFAAVTWTFNRYAVSLATCYNLPSSDAVSEGNGLGCNQASSLCTRSS